MKALYRVRLKPQAHTFLFFTYYKVDGYLDYTFRYDIKDTLTDDDWRMNYYPSYSSYSLTFKGVKRAKARVTKRAKRLSDKEAKLSDLEANLKALEETVYL